MSLELAELKEARKGVRVGDTGLETPGGKRGVRLLSRGQSYLHGFISSYMKDLWGQSQGCSFQALVSRRRKVLAQVVDGYQL